MMNKKINILQVCLALIIFFSCKKQPDDKLAVALTFAGINKVELQKLLDHYSSPKDSLKLKAAKFLIVNMPIHYGYQSSSIDKYSKIFNIIDTLYYKQDQVTNDEKARIGDSVVSITGYPDPNSVQMIDDSKIITANYLINNIDFAFKAWKNAPWSKRVNFDDFCEYILPYRIRDEEMQYWRPKLYHQYTPMSRTANKVKDLKSVFDLMNWNLNTETTFTVYFNRYYPFSQSVNDVKLGKIGGCETTTFYSATVMRSIGLPVAVDYILHWGSTNNGHYMVNVIDQKNKPTLISNENILHNTWSLVDFSSDYIQERHVFKESELPDGMYVQNVKTIPKVYRYTYSKIPELDRLMGTVPEQYLAPEFRKSNIKDVTDQFVKTGVVSFNIKKELEKQKVAYLCVFDVNGWKPVALQEMHGGSVVFDKIGCYVVYLPAVYDSGRFVPISPPFYIDTLNVISNLNPNLNTKQNIKLVRKYPMHSYTAYHTEALKGGRFEGANSANFTDANTLFPINTYPFYMNDITVANNKKFRYLRYVAPPGGTWEADNIAEVQFYDQDGVKPLTGKQIGTPGTAGHEIGKAFDNDMDSFYQNAYDKNGWIGIDLGPGNARKISKISFCPRNDTNCIIPGYQYELFYWDNSWISLGAKTTSSYALDYQQIPKGALFWLKCKSNGHEERIFTIEDGKQKWW